LLALGVALATLAAFLKVGWLFGFVVGAAHSPIAATAAPIIVGLLAVAGVSAIAAVRPDDWTRLRMLAMIVAALGVVGFCERCYTGILKGTLVHDASLVEAKR
jgi:hypothetical protein